MQHEVRRVILLIAGIAILTSAALHGVVNVPHLHEDLMEFGVRPTLLGAVMLVLYFSVVAMFAFGGMVVGSAMGVFRDDRSGQAALWIIAVGYAVFGFAGFMLVSGTPHMLGYAAMGFLVAIGAALSRSRTEADRRNVT